MEKSIYSEQYILFLSFLKNTRKGIPLTQEQLAERLGQTQSFISKVERGERRIDIIELREFCRALDLPFPSFVKQFDQLLTKRKEVNESTI